MIFSILSATLVHDICTFSVLMSVLFTNSTPSESYEQLLIKSPYPGIPQPPVPYIFFIYSTFPDLELHFLKNSFAFSKCRCFSASSIFLPVII
jgi:hypothetical protein|nr:MAG TPA: hypothetical protein [Caudoviricetes sp.]